MDERRKQRLAEKYGHTKLKQDQKKGPAPAGGPGARQRNMMMSARPMPNAFLRYVSKVFCRLWNKPEMRSNREKAGRHRM